MLCPNSNCTKPVSPFDEVCEHCGMPLKEPHPIKDYLKKADKIISDAESKEKEIQAEIKKGFREQELSHTPVEKDQFQKKDYWTEREDISKIRAEDIPQMIKEKKKDQLRSWQVSYLHEMVNTVFSNPNILENKAYENKVQRTNFKIGFDNIEVNGHARLLKKKEIEETNGRFFFEILIYEGYLNLTYAVAASIIDTAGGLGIYNEPLLKSAIRQYKEQKGKFSIDDLIAVLPEGQEIVGIGPNASAALFQCIAHELGHICYDHVFSDRDYDFRTSVSNIEMEHHADGFARIIIDRSAFREQLWKGYLQYQIVSAAVSYYQPGVNLYEPETHPLRIDRLKEAIRRFRDLADKYGIDEKWAEDTVNKIRDWLK